MRSERKRGSRRAWLLCCAIVGRIDLLRQPAMETYEVSCVILNDDDDDSDKIRDMREREKKGECLPGDDESPSCLPA